MRMLRASTDQLVAADPVRPPDHFGRAEDLADLDDGGPAQGRRHGQMQLLERADALGARERRQPSRVQLVGENNRRRLAEPGQARLVLRVLERHDQDAREGRRLRPGGRRPEERQRGQHEEAAQRHEDVRRPRLAGRRPDHHRHDAALSAAGGAAGVQPGFSGDSVVMEHARDRRGVEAAQRMNGRFPHLAEQRAAKIDRGLVLLHADDGTRAGIGGAHQASRRPQRRAGAPAQGQRPEDPALERGDVGDRPIGRVLACASDDLRVDFPFSAQEAEDGEQRRQADGADAEAAAAQPVLVELETIGQQLGDRLVQAGHQHASDARLTHARLRRSR